MIVGVMRWNDSPGRRLRLDAWFNGHPGTAWSLPEPAPGFDGAALEQRKEGPVSLYEGPVIMDQAPQTRRRNVAKSPQGSEWELRGVKTGVVLHSGITEHSAAHLLKGKTEVPLGGIAVGGETTIKIDDLTFRLVRTA